MQEGAMLARFQVNPKKVRVSVRPVGKSWIARVAERKEGGLVSDAVSRSAKKAVELALNTAANYNMEGIDLSLQWAYEHPQKVVSS